MARVQSCATTSATSAYRKLVHKNRPEWGGFFVTILLMQSLLLFAFIFGSIIGSFLNVLVLRYGMRTLRGRSACFSCGKRLAWHELIPLLSFVAQGGRCRGCKSAVSLQYPLVELLTGLVFMGIVWRESDLILSLASSISLSSILYLLLTPVLWSLLIAILVYDIRHKIIPDALVYSAIGSALLIFLSSHIPYSVPHASSLWLDLSGSLLLSAPFAALWYFSRGRAMGLGDAKLIFLFSPYLGFSAGLSAMLLGFWIGAVLSIAAILLKSVSALSPKLRGLKRHFKGLTMKTEMPLAPFLIAGLFIVYICGIDVTGLGMLLQNTDSC